MDKHGNGETFQTHDLYLAGALEIHNFRLIDLKRNSNGRGIFVFEDYPNRTEYVKQYFSGELTGSLKGFSNAWADLKGLISEMEMERSNARNYR